MTIKIYGPSYSTCTMRTLCTLFEKEVTDYELIPVDLSKGEHKAPENLKRQPFGQVPSMTDDDLTVFESRAIARYICNKYENQGSNLTGKTLAEKAVIDTWLEAEHANYHPAIAAIVAEKVFKPMFGGVTDEARVASESQKLDATLSVYEGVLSHRPYLAGEHFSLADLSHLSYAFYLIHKANSPELFDKHKHVKEWIERCFARPAWKKTLALQGH